MTKYEINLIKLMKIIHCICKIITATYTFMPYFRSQQKLKIHMGNLCLMPCVPSFSYI